MKITLFTTSADCTNLGEFKCSHISMFEKDMSIAIHFITHNDTLEFIRACINHFILIKVQGDTVTIIPEPNNYQRVRFRFDSK